jgi:hypothetical protein
MKYMKIIIKFSFFFAISQIMEYIEDGRFLLVNKKKFQIVINKYVANIVFK